MSTLKEILPGLAALLAIIAGTIGLLWFAVGWSALLAMFAMAAGIAALLGALFAVHWFMQSRWLAIVCVPALVIALIAIGGVRRCAP